MKHVVTTLLVSSISIAAETSPLTNLSSGETGRIQFQSMTPLSLWTYTRRNLTDTKIVTVWGDLLFPPGISAGAKVPALVLSHGSSGVSPYAYEIWATKMNAAGVAVFIVDSFKPRGIKETAQDQGVLSLKPPRKPEPVGSREFQPTESLHEEIQIQ